MFRGVIQHFLFSFAGFLALGSPLASRAESAPDQWVTVFYQIKNQQVTVVGVDGEQTNVGRGHYLEAYLPRSLFPAGSPVTRDAVMRLDPKVLLKGFTSGFLETLKQHCDKIDGEISRRANQIMDQAAKSGQTPIRMENGNPGLVDVSLLNQQELKGITMEPLLHTAESELVEQQSFGHCTTGPALPEPEAMQPAGCAATRFAYQGYSSSKEVTDAIYWAQLLVTVRTGGNLQKEQHSNECCKAFISRALAYSHLANAPIQGSTAYDMMPGMKAEHFDNLLLTHPGMTAREAPKGAILVYDAGSYLDKEGKKHRRPGHVEIKTAEACQDGYVSDFLQAKPASLFTSAKYKLVGIYVK